MAKMTSRSVFGIKAIVLLWVTIFSIWSTISITEGRQISKEDYLEAKRLLKHLHRPSVKSVQAENGDIFDCVMVDKQLAFDHPALENHTIQMKPTYIPEEMKDNDGSNQSHAVIGLKDGGCPVGTVPVRRLQIDDILRYKSLPSRSLPSRSFRGKYSIKAEDLSEHLWATVESRGDYFGTRATLNIWNPKVNSHDQFSLSQLWIANEGSTTETIEAGWTVYPDEYQTYQTRFFTYWTNDNYGKSGCYNAVCPGFVQVNHKVPLDATLKASTLNGQQFYVNVAVAKDSKTQNWWLSIDGVQIGYWPKDLYKGLSSGAATEVDWGGEVLNSNRNSQPWPPMGSGQFPVTTNFKGQSCSTSGIQVLGKGSQWNDYGAAVASSTKSNCFKIIDGGKQAQWGRVITFGGPGGTC